MKQYSFLMEEINPQGAALGFVGGSVVGGGLGLGLGAYGGAKLVNAVSGKKERIAIKNIILSSDSPEECIEKLKQLRSTKALKYIERVKVVQNLPDWKLRLIKGINIKNITGTGLGAIGGGYLGAKSGAIIGGISGGLMGANS